MRAAQALDRLHAAGVRWGVDLEEIRETEGSVLGFGAAGSTPVVVKIIRFQHEEWSAGEVLDAFAGRGMVRALAWEPGAVLLERLAPATSLLPIVYADGDEEALGILAGVIGRMPALAPSSGLPSALDWGRAFGRYRSAGSATLPEPLVEQAHDTYEDLCRSRQDVRVLHGDLHYENVVYDARRGWLAIDPKGVVAELAYELGAVLRNPGDRPELHTPAALDRRAAFLAGELGVDRERTLRWTFAQAVLSALWAVEDGHRPRAGPALRVAAAARELLA